LCHKDLRISGRPRNVPRRSGTFRNFPFRSVLFPLLPGARRRHGGAPRLCRGEAWCRVPAFFPIAWCPASPGRSAEAVPGRSPVPSWECGVGSAERRNRNTGIPGDRKTDEMSNCRFPISNWVRGVASLCRPRTYGFAGPFRNFPFRSATFRNFPFRSVSFRLVPPGSAGVTWRS